MELPSKQHSSADTSGAVYACAEDDTFWPGSEPNDGSNQELGAGLFVCVSGYPACYYLTCNSGWSTKSPHYTECRCAHFLHTDACFLHTDACNEDYFLSTPDKRLEELDWNDRFADSLSLSDDGAPEHSPQISPASVLSSTTTSPIKVANAATNFHDCGVC